MLLILSLLFFIGDVCVASNVFNPLKEFPPSERFPSFIIARTDKINAGNRGGHRTPTALSGLPFNIGGIFYLIGPEGGSGGPVELLPEEKLHQYINHENLSRKRQTVVAGKLIWNEHYGKKAPPFVEGMRNEDILSKTGCWYAENVNNGHKKEEGDNSIDLHRIAFQTPKPLKRVNGNANQNHSIWEVDPTQVERPNFMLQLGSVPPAGMPGWVVALRDNDGVNHNARNPPAMFSVTEPKPGDFVQRFSNPTNLGITPKLRGVSLICEGDRRTIYDSAFLACWSPNGNGKVYLAYASSLSEALGWNPVWKHFCVPIGEISFTRLPLPSVSQREAQRELRFQYEERRKAGKLEKLKNYDTDFLKQEEYWTTKAEENPLLFKDEFNLKMEDLDAGGKEDDKEIKDDESNTKKEEPVVDYSYAGLRHSDSWAKERREYENSYHVKNEEDLGDLWQGEEAKGFKKLKSENTDRDMRIHEFRELIPANPFPATKQENVENLDVTIPDQHYPPLNQPDQRFLRNFEIPVLNNLDQDWARLHQIYQSTPQAVNPDGIATKEADRQATTQRLKPKTSRKFT